MLYPPFFAYFIQLRAKYFPEHTVFQNFSFVFSSNRPCFTTTKELASFVETGHTMYR
jgi:hypothetical protein